MTMEAETLQVDLLQLLCRIAKNKGRIEITNCEGGNCVLISKAELDSLEAALEILSNTDGAKQLERAIERFAMMSAV
jgi:PHD/YefM family antitoxin component YafN of YafNO toxin-antitoxin module